MRSQKARNAIYNPLVFSMEFINRIAFVRYTFFRKLNVRIIALDYAIEMCKCGKWNLILNQTVKMLEI